jgi:hypothetical protein
MSCNIICVQLFWTSNFQHAVCNALGGNSLKINICNFIDCSCVLLMDIANERWRGKYSHLNLNDFYGVLPLFWLSVHSPYLHRNLIKHKALETIKQNILTFLQHRNMFRSFAGNT